MHTSIMESSIFNGVLNQVKEDNSKELPVGIRGITISLYNKYFRSKYSEISSTGYHINPTSPANMECMTEHNSKKIAIHYFLTTQSNWQLSLLG